MRELKRRTITKKKSSKAKKSAKSKKVKTQAVVKHVGAIGKYEPNIVNQIEEAIHSGLSNKKACELVEISQHTFYDWIEKHPQFLQKIKKARAIKCKTYADGIRAAGFGEMDAKCPKCKHEFKLKLSLKQWQAIAWLAERTEPEEFGQKSMNVTKMIKDGEEKENFTVREVIIEI